MTKDSMYVDRYMQALVGMVVGLHERVEPQFLKGERTYRFRSGIMCSSFHYLSIFSDLSDIFASLSLATK